MSVKAYLQINMVIDEDNRAKGAEVFTKYKDEFLKNIKGAETKDLLVRDEDVQVLHGFSSVEDAENYLESELFKEHVFVELQPLWSKDPDVRIYQVM